MKAQLCKSLILQFTGYQCLMLFTSKMSHVKFARTNVQNRVSDYKSMDISKKIYYSASFLELKMAAATHTTRFLEFQSSNREKSEVINNNSTRLQRARLQKSKQCHCFPLCQNQQILPPLTCKPRRPSKIDFH